MNTHKSVKCDKFEAAVQEYCSYQWKKQKPGGPITVWEILNEGAGDDKWDFHLSNMMDPTSQNVTKFHFTLRYGSDKSNSYFAWFKIEGHNAAAYLDSRENKGNLNLPSQAPASF